MNRLQTILWIAGSGAFGGIAEGLVMPRSYRLRAGKTVVELGSIGDAIVGAAAGVAIFAIAGSVFNTGVIGDLKQVEQPSEFLRILAWGVLSGFAGLRALQPMSEALITKIAGQAARDVVKAEVIRSRGADVYLRDAEAALTKFDFAREQGWLVQRRPQLDELITVANNKIDAALALSPDHPDAMRCRAKVLRRRADLAASDGNSAEWRRRLQEAVELLSRIVEHNPEYSLAWYNRACYRNLLGSDDKVVCADLREAIRLNSALRDAAASDPDFTNVREKADFLGIVPAVASMPFPRTGAPYATPLSTPANTPAATSASAPVSELVDTPQGSPGHAGRARGSA